MTDGLLDIADDGGSDCLARIGMAKLAKLAFDGGDLRPMWAESSGRLLDGKSDAGEAIDLSLIAQLLGHKDAGLALQHDVLLSPTIARTHLPLGTVRMDGTLEQYQQGLAPMIPFTAVCNATGVPAMSAPLSWMDDGLPIGMHFIGRYGAEEMLFSLAAELERAAPWRDRRPPGGKAT